MSKEQKNGKKKKSFVRILILLLGVAVLTASLLLLSGFHPADVQSEEIQSQSAGSALSPTNSLSVLFLDAARLRKGLSSNLIPTQEQMEYAAQKLLDQISNQDPTFVVITGLDQNHVQTGKVDQMGIFQTALSESYPFSTMSFYKKSPFNPQKGIRGSVGEGILVLSKTRIGGAVRYALKHENPKLFNRLYEEKPFLLLMSLPFENSQSLSLVIAHFSTNDLMQQEEHASSLLKQNGMESSSEKPWILVFTSGSDSSLSDIFKTGDSLNVLSPSEESNQNANFIEWVLVQTNTNEEQPDEEF